MSYLRVKTEDHTGKVSWVQLEVISEDEAWLLGRPVTKTGEDKSHYNADGVLVDVQHLIDKATILDRVEMVMNPVYGELEKAR